MKWTQFLGGFAVGYLFYAMVGNNKSGIGPQAGELRESVKNHGNRSSSKTRKKPAPAKTKPDRPLEQLLTAMQDFDLTGQEKLLIRLDERVVFLMKQLKFAKGIDMNRLMAFCLQDFFRQHPELINTSKTTSKP